MASLECPRCETRFDKPFTATARCPYCNSHGVIPPPALRRVPAIPGEERLDADRARAASYAVDRLRAGRWWAAIGTTWTGPH